MSIFCLDNRIVQRFMSYGMLSEDNILSSVQYLRLPYKQEFTQEHLNSVIFPIIDKYMLDNKACSQVINGIPLEVIRQLNTFGIYNTKDMRSMCDDILEFANSREKASDTNYLLLKYTDMFLYYLERGESNSNYSTDIEEE